MMNDFLEWYNFSRKNTSKETLAHQLDCGLLALQANPALLINSIAANLPIGQSLLKLMKPSTNQNSPLSSPVMEDFDPHSDSSDSDEVKYAEDFAEPNNNCEASANIDDGSSDSSRDSTTNPSQFWKSLTKNNGKPKEAPEIILCFWCKRVCEGKNQLEGESGGQGGFPLTNGDRHFCSEICFTQCRRASFKKSKICDWCRHVRSTVSYVDFNDGNHQLQFCSDKCLNQYKMHIFCRETEAHLQLHPHLNDLNMSKDGTLITPDLWLNNCEETSQPKIISKDLLKEVEDDYSDEETKETEVANKSHISSSSSLGDTSPVSFFDDAEPVNLSTTESKRSPLRPRSCRGAEDYRTRLATRYGRPPKNSSGESGLYGKSKSFKSSNYREGFEMKPKGTIRVRQLEEQPRLEVPSSMSPSSSAASALPGFTAFGGLLLGSRPPLLSNIPNLLPPPPPSDIPRPQILPQLLLSHPDLLRFQGLRASFMLQQPPIQPSQQPQSLPPPPTQIPTQPHPPLHSNIPKPMGFPPVTVLLPLPLPIPIPIPIPIPFPFPVKDFEKYMAKNRDHQEPEESTNLAQESPKKDKKGESSETSSGKRKGSCDLSVPPPPLIRPNTSRISDFEHSFVKDSASESLPQDPKGERKERRSILRYTSDVYEVNGVFVPRGGGWDNLPTASTSNTKKNDEIASPISYETPATTSTKPKESPTSLPEETRSSSSSKKRPSESECNQPMPKKRHLLT